MTDWSSVLKERQGLSLNSGEGSDLTIIVGSEEKEFKVHRYMLSLCSPILKDKINALKAGETELNFPEIDPSSMKTLLKYAYTGEYGLKTNKDFRVTFELFKTAIYFQFMELAEHCTDYLRPLLTTENVLMLLKNAMLDGHKPPISHAMEFINRNGDAILESEQFQDLSLDCVFEIVKQDDLQTESELKVFNAVYKWGEAEAKRQSLDPKDPFQIRTIINKPLKWIRFPLMIADEYGNVFSPKGLLHNKEIDNLLRFFMTPQEKRSTMSEELFVSRPRKLKPINLGNRPHLKVSIEGDPVIKILFDVDTATCDGFTLKSMLKDKFNYPMCLAVMFNHDYLDSYASTFIKYGITTGSEIKLTKIPYENDKEYCLQCYYKPGTYCNF